MARVLDALPPTHTANGSTATGPAPAAAAIDPTEGAGPTGGGGGGAGGAPSDMLLSGFFSVMFAIALDGSQGVDFRIGNTDALSALVALACRALVCLHTDLWHEAMRGVWHESAGRAVSLHGERQRALELVEQARARWPRERRLQKYAARLLAGPEPEPEPELGKHEPQPG